MTDPYATADQLIAHIGEEMLLDASLPEINRLLARASALLDAKAIRTAFDVDAETGLPTDTDIATALADACCAQVEFWLEVGETSDIDGMAGRQSSIGGMSLTLPGRIADRAIDHLASAGLTTVGAVL